MQVTDSGVQKFTAVPKSVRVVASILDELPALDVGKFTEVVVADEKELNTFRAAVGRRNKATAEAGIRLVLRQAGKDESGVHIGVYCVDGRENPAPKRAPRGSKKGGKKA